MKTAGLPGGNFSASAESNKHITEYIKGLSKMKNWLSPYKCSFRLLWGTTENSVLFRKTLYQHPIKGCCAFGTFGSFSAAPKPTRYTQRGRRTCLRLFTEGKAHLVHRLLLICYAHNVLYVISHCRFVMRAEIGHKQHCVQLLRFCIIFVAHHDPAQRFIWLEALQAVSFIAWHLQLENR